MERRQKGCRQRGLLGCTRDDLLVLVGFGRGTGCKGVHRGDADERGAQATGGAQAKAGA